MNNIIYNRFFLLMVFFLGNIPCSIAQGDAASHHELAARILTSMRLSETAKTTKLIEITVTYLNELEGVLKQRSVTLEGIEGKYKKDSQQKDSLIVKTYEVARDKYLPVKKVYTNHLEDNLTAYQVEWVKDGLTYDTFPNFYAMYLEMVPMLKPVEKAHIKVLLIEGRENAMLAISREGQKRWWDKYRGIVNNYIASQGYDFGKLSKSWDNANQDKDWAH